MKCKREGCGRPVTGKAQYCSGACRTKVSRAKNPQTPVTVPTVISASVTVGGKCYNRLAIRCPEFGTRPCPVAATDKPVPKNRGRYKRLDGTVYQFDAGGQVFECKHPFKDKQGKEHLAVYETVADARKAAGGAWA